MRTLSLVVGLLVVLSAVVSAATLSNAFVGYLQVFLSVPHAAAIILTVVVAGLVAAQGIKESAFAAMVLTLIEVGGLLLIVWVGRNGLAEFPQRVAEFVPAFDGKIWTGIMVGAFISFYAFIGFEDMANVAEEVKNPHRNLPLGICLALGGATILYGIIAVVAVLSLPTSELAATDAPLALIYERNTGSSPVIITFISLFAIINGLLVQIIMASRILYGLSSRAWLPAILKKVNPRTHTPVFATVLIALLILIFALWFPLVKLAQITSFVVLVIFAVVNLACIRIKLSEPHPEDVRTFPIIIPILGFISFVSFVIFRVGVFLAEFV